MARRGFTELTTNATLISQIDERDLAAVMSGRLPPRCATQLLHEVTHHSCFLSPVGTALALLSCRARMLAMFARLGDTDDDDPFLEAYVRYRWTDGMLRPWSEGMALFAEHDLVVGHTETASTPLVVATVALGGHDREVGKNLRLLNPILLEARLDEKHVQRKASLLAQEPSFTDGGYLCGYLTLKQVWLHLLRLCPELFSDSDFFLLFANSWVWHDWAFVEVLLAPEHFQIDVFHPIAEHLRRRLDQLVSMTRPQLLALAKPFEARVKANKGGTFIARFEGHTFGLDYLAAEGDVPDNHRGKELLRRLVSETLLTAGDPGTPAGAYRFIELELFGARQYVTLLSARMSCVTDGSGDIAAFAGLDAPERRLFIARDFGGPLPSWKGEADVDVLLSISPPGMALVLAVGDCKPSVRRLSGKLAPHVERLGVMPLAKRVSLTGELWENAQSHFRDNELGKTYEDHLERNLAIALAALYQPVEHGLASAADAPDGFLSILDNDRDALSDAAAISLLAPFQLARDAHPALANQFGERRSAAELNARMRAKVQMTPFFLRPDAPSDHEHVLFSSI